MYAHRNIVRVRNAVSSLLIAILIGSVILSIAVLMILPSTTFVGRTIESIRSGTEGGRMLRALVLENGLVIENQGKDLVKILYLVLTYNNGTTKIVNVNTVLNPGESISIDTNEAEKLSDINVVTEDNGKTTLVHPSIEYRIPLEIPEVKSVLFEEKSLNKTSQGTQGSESGEESEEEGQESYGAELTPSTEESSSSGGTSLEELVNESKETVKEVVETIENIVESISETIEEGPSPETISEIISTIQQIVSSEVPSLIQNLTQNVPEVTEEQSPWLVQLILKDLAELKRLITRLAYYDAKRSGNSFDYEYNLIISRPWLEAVKFILVDVMYKLLAIMAYDGDPSTVHQAMQNLKYGIDRFLHNEVEGLEMVKNVLEDTVVRISERDDIPIVYDLTRYLLIKNGIIDNSNPEVVLCSGSVDLRLVRGACDVYVDLYEEGKSIHIYSKAYLKVEKLKCKWILCHWGTVIDLNLTIDIRIGDVIDVRAYDHGIDITPTIVDKLINVIEELEKLTEDDLVKLLLSVIGIDVNSIVNSLEHLKAYLEYLKANDFAIPATISNKYAFMLMYLMHLYLDSVNRAVLKYITEYKEYEPYDIYRMYIKTSSGPKDIIAIHTKTKITVYLNNITYIEDLGKLCTIASLYCDKWFVNISLKNVKTGREYQASRTLREVLSEQTIDFTMIIDEVGNYSLYIYINDAFSNVINKRSLVIYEAIGNTTIDSITTELKRIQT